jgi:anti-anti-sigma factor
MITFAVPPPGDANPAEPAEAGDIARPTEPSLDTAGAGHLAISGDLDQATIPEVRERLFTYLDQHTARPLHDKMVVVDLGGLGYIPSAGIALLLELADDAQSRALHLRLRYPPGASVDRVLTLTGLTAHAAVSVAHSP